MRSFRNAAFVAFFIAAPGIYAQTAQDWRFAHPGATLIGGFRVKAVLDSPLVNTLIAQATDKNPSAAAMVGMARTALGGVTGVRFSVRDRGKGKDPDVLALVSGALDDATVSMLTQNQAQGKTSMRRIDAGTLLIGEGPSLEEAVARMGKPAVGLQARALDRSKAFANYDLWIAGTLPELPMTVPVLDSLRSLGFGISAQNDLRVEIALETASAAMAEELISSARKAQVQQPRLGAALQSEVDGSTARFRFVMEGNQVIQAVQQAIESKGGSSPLAAFLGQSAALPQFTESPRPAKPQRDTIVIYGLEDGPREIKSPPKP